MDSQFDRTKALIGEKALIKLFNSKIAIFGIGGVGSFVVEALARVGIGEIDLIDNDKINITNINRQIIALHSTIGHSKVDVAKKRALDINPNIQINTFKKYYSTENSKDFNLKKYDYIEELQKNGDRVSSYKIPWNEILKDDFESNPVRGFKEFWMPWKSE